MNILSIDVSHEQQDSWEELKAFLINRIEKTKNSEPIKKTIEQIAEEEIDLGKS